MALLLQLGSTLPLVGLIWMVQVVVYPQFRNVGGAEFPAYHAAHARRITFVVGPLMVGEAIGAALAVAATQSSADRATALLGAALVVLAWGVTMGCSVPQHQVLARGFDARADAILRTTNWLRTLAWSARGAMPLVAAARGGEAL